MAEYLYNNDKTVDSIKCLEVLMKGIDINTQKLLEIKYKNLYNSDI
jgi:hypothetical protein